MYSAATPLHSAATPLQRILAPGSHAVSHIMCGRRSSVHSTQVHVWLHHCNKAHTVHRALRRGCKSSKRTFLAACEAAQTGCARHTSVCSSMLGRWTPLPEAAWQGVRRQQRSQRCPGQLAAAARAGHCRACCMPSSCSSPCCASPAEA